MRRVKENIVGKKGILLFNIFSKFIAVISIMMLIGTTIGGIYGINELTKKDVNYVELAKNEDFDFALTAIDFTQDEFLEMVDQVNTVKGLVTMYSIYFLENIFAIVFLLVFYICVWLVTDNIKKNENMPFTKENLNILTKGAIVLIFILAIQLVPSILTDRGIVTQLEYLLMICIFRYLFDVGCKLQEK